MLPPFRSAMPLLLTAVFHLAGFGAERSTPTVAGERSFAGCVTRRAPSVPWVCPLWAPAFSGCCDLLWPNHTEDFDIRPYFVRYPVIQYGYQSLTSGQRMVYRSDATRFASPGRPAFYAAPPPRLSLSRGVLTSDLRRDAAPLAGEPAALPHRPVPKAFPVLVRNPFAKQDRVAEQNETESLPAVNGGKVTVVWETSEPIRTLRIVNPHVRSEE
ncbi:MAG: hypothetical protein ACUVTW_02405 [Thermogutta sp.]